jgi:ribosomal protein S18 acetylase RimI-like enzyme
LLWRVPYLDPYSFTLVKLSENSGWYMGSPWDLSRDFSEAELSAAVSAPVSYIQPMVDPRSFTRITGPEQLVDLFIDTCIREMMSGNVRIEALPPFFRSKDTYATLSTIPPPSPAFSQYRIELAAPNDLDSVSQLCADYTAATPVPTLTFEEAKKRIALRMQMEEVWVCRVEGRIAGYCLTGRATAHTVAICNIYVSPEHRRKGVAEALTRAMTRYYLGAQPLGFEGAPISGPPKGIKREVCLIVAEEHVERLYKRCGFLLGVEDCDPETGKRGWYRSTARGMKISDE